jgi:hypothetical protein
VKTSPWYPRIDRGTRDARPALDGQRSLVLRHAKYHREADENGVIINLTNVVSVRVSKTDSAATGQYL